MVLVADAPTQEQYAVLQAEISAAAEELRAQGQVLHTWAHFASVRILPPGSA